MYVVGKFGNYNWINNCHTFVKEIIKLKYVKPKYQEVQLKDTDAFYDFVDKANEDLKQKKNGHEVIVNVGSGK